MALVEKFKPAAIIETGTYLGTTTEFMAATGVPVYSVEGNLRPMDLRARGYGENAKSRSTMETAAILCARSLLVRCRPTRATPYSLIWMPIGTMICRSLMSLDLSSATARQQW